MSQTLTAENRCAIARWLAIACYAREQLQLAHVALIDLTGEADVDNGFCADAVFNGPALGRFLPLEAADELLEALELFVVDAQATPLHPEPSL